MTEGDPILAEGVSRKRNERQRFWRVRHHPEGMYLLESLGKEYRAVWRMIAQDPTQEAAVSKFNLFARPLPPGRSLPIGVKAAPYTHPDREREESEAKWQAEKEAHLAEQQEQQLAEQEERRRALLSGLAPNGRRWN